MFEPSVVAIDEQSGRVQAVGEEARRMIGRTPATIRAVRPLRHGVIADFDMTAQMLRYFIRRVGGGAFSRVVLCVPSGTTKVERAAVEEATLEAGARRVSLIEEPMAAAIGAGLAVAEAQGTMIVDIGGGTTEVAVLALGGIVVWESVRVGGYEMDDALVRHLDGAQHLLIGPETAEAAKIACGSAWESVHRPATEVAGRDRITGLLRRTTISSEQVRSAIDHSVGQIVEAVKRTLESTPPELAADISSSGMLLAGGGALLAGIDGRLAAETGVASASRKPHSSASHSAPAARSKNEVRSIGRHDGARARRYCGTGAGAPEQASAYGRMFWLSWKTLSGSQARFTSTSFSYLASP